MKAKPYVAVGVFVAGAALLLVGVLRGEPDIVLHKAVRICLECIGLG
jgi:hypothetical protein